MANSIYPYQINEEYNNALYTSQSFVTLLQKYKERRERLNKLEEEIGEPMKPVHILLTFLGIIALIGLVIWEGYMGQMSITAAMDPEGESSLKYLPYVFGSIIAVVAIKSGHLLHPAIIGTKNIYTGKRKYNFDRKSFFGILFILTIIFFQYSLLQNASGGKEEFKIYDYIVILMPIIEILFGLLFLEDILNYTGIMWNTKKLDWIQNKLNQLAREAFGFYKNYTLMRDAWNKMYPENPFPNEKHNANLQLALQFFHGENSDTTSESNTQLLEESNSQITTENENLNDTLLEPQVPNMSNSNSESNTNLDLDELNNFMDDENITL